MSVGDFVDEDGVTRLRGTYAGGGSQPVTLAAVHFSAAELQAITDPGVNVIEAAGLGTAIAPVALGFTWRFATTPYTSGSVGFAYGPGLVVGLQGTPITTLNAVFTSVSNTFCPLMPVGPGSVPVDLINVENLPLCIYSDDPLVGGGGSLSLSILYAVQAIDAA